MNELFAISLIISRSWVFVKLLLHLIFIKGPKFVYVVLCDLPEMVNDISKTKINKLWLYLISPIVCLGFFLIVFLIEIGQIIDETIYPKHE